MKWIYDFHTDSVKEEDDGENLFLRKYYGNPDNWGISGREYSWRANKALPKNWFLV